LELPKPDIYLNVGSGTHSEQTSNVMIKFEKIVLKEKPDLVLVYGDVNSTIAASLVCSKIIINHSHSVPVAHIESGLRSNDRTMPEEINRILTDRLSKYHFVTEKDGVDNLMKEGFRKDNIFYVGNTMIDSVKNYIRKAKNSNILDELCLSRKKYSLITLHRPSNVDIKSSFINILNIIKDIQKTLPGFDIVFPVHPRTVKMLKTFNLEDELYKINNLILTEPLGYFDFLNLIINAALVLTDSGGIQEETTFLKIPCLTLRENTERPTTYEIGTNTICGLNRTLILEQIIKIKNNKYKKGKIPLYWDGKSSYRIAKIIRNILLD
jgi:UDP-N-acetylglucosamine 2-epimerase (non-hydrolysing)